MKWERKGSSREVVLIGQWAIKFPKLYSWETFLWGLLANMQEIQFSKLNWPELCPIIWYIPGGFLVVMPRCKILIRNDFCEEKINEIFTNAKLHNRCLPVEMKPDSWGFLNGRLIAVDYG